MFHVAGEKCVYLLMGGLSYSRGWPCLAWGFPLHRRIGTYLAIITAVPISQFLFMIHILSINSATLKPICGLLSVLLCDLLLTLLTFLLDVHLSACNFPLCVNSHFSFCTSWVCHLMFLQLVVFIHLLRGNPSYPCTTSSINLCLVSIEVCIYSKVRCMWPHASRCLGRLSDYRSCSWQDDLPLRSPFVSLHVVWSRLGTRGDQLWALWPWQASNALWPYLVWLSNTFFLLPWSPVENPLPPWWPLFSSA